MKISRCIKNPVLYIRKALYYAIGNTVARMFYPPRLYKSVWFSGLSSLGWEWATKGLLHQTRFPL